MDAIEEVYQKYAKTVYGFLLIRTKNADTAEELTQETFYQAIKSISKFDGKSKLSTWLCGIAQNVWYNWLKKQKKHRYIPLDEITEADGLTVESAEQQMMRKMERETICNSLARMPEPAKSVLYLRLFEQMSFREIGEALGKKENWARVTFYRAKEKLCREVQENEAGNSM